MFYIHILLTVEDCEAESVILFSGKYCIFIFVISCQHFNITTALLPEFTHKLRFILKKVHKPLQNICHNKYKNLTPLYKNSTITQGKCMPVRR
jgi:hypothetical protein